MTDVFALVLTASLYGSLTGLFALGCKRLLSKTLNAKWQYLIWIVLLAKLLFPFGPESPVSVFNAVPDIAYQVPVSPTLPPSDVSQRPIVIDSPAAPIHPYGELSVALTLRDYAALVWAIGLLGMILWLLGSCLLFNRQVRRGMVDCDARLERILSKARVRMGMSSQIQLCVGSFVTTPALCGLLSPRILLPAAATTFSDDELEYIMLHELAHYRRKDIMVNYLLLALQAVHWFNPFIWYLFRCLRQDMELATDEYVLSLLESPEHRAYGQALLTVLARFPEAQLSARLVYMADDKRDMERRIRMIKWADSFKRRQRLVVAIGLLCIAVLGGVLLTSAVNQDSTSLRAIELFSVFQGEGVPDTQLRRVLEPHDVEVVMAALENSTEMGGILKVTLPHYELRLHYRDQEMTTVWVWLDRERLQGMIMYTSDTHKGYTLRPQDVSLLLEIFAPREIDLNANAYPADTHDVGDWGALTEAERIGALLGFNDVYKLVRPAGATVDEFLYFTYVNNKPQLVVGFYASQAWEVDVNNSGAREIVYTFGSPGPNIRILQAMEGQVREVNLNYVFDSPSVEFDPSSKEFLVTYPHNGEIYRYRLSTGTWVLTPVSE